MRTFSQILLTQALIFFEPDAIVQVRYRLTLIAVSSGASEQNREDIVQDVLFQVIRQVLAQQQVPWQSGLGWRYLRNAIRNQVIGFREKSSRPEFLEFLGQQQRVASPNVPASGRDVIIPDLQRLFDYLAQRARLARRSCDRETFDVAWQELRIALFLPPKARGGRTTRLLNRVYKRRERIKRELAVALQSLELEKGGEWDPQIVCAARRILGLEAVSV